MIDRLTGLGIRRRTAARIDGLAARIMLGRSARARARSENESLGPAERVEALARIAEIYRPFEGSADLFDGGGPLEVSAKRRPPRVLPERGRMRRYAGARPPRGQHVEVTDLYWASRARTLCPDVQGRFDEHEGNQTARARLFSIAGARPAVVLIHGYRAGQFALEERVWPTSWFLRRGFDVALFVLPFHAGRAARGRGPLFPSSDPRVTNEAFRQAVLDARGLITLLRERGATRVGALGMSLGGYTTALLATAEDRLDFAAPIIPLASLADMARYGGRLVGTEREIEEQHAGLVNAHRVVSPLHRALAIPSHRVCVLAGEADRITPVEQARKLADHFAAPISTFPGGHLLQFGRSQAFSALEPLLRG